MIRIVSNSSCKDQIDRIINIINDIKVKQNLDIEHKIFGNILEFKIKNKNKYINRITFVIIKDNNTVVDIFSENNSIIGDIAWKV
ncbi:hypothetical protein DFR86_02705 [Acidianus sulfidivorans JP7]|uniref:Uncharacterized protein n=1 Tax=Acidianus sulfidivorans JP7 TaxID=619593 RepID=A0A2U9IKW3_9CREN|nr:hypothetical protein [Acidianus sulfidivorans]AWR96564.1 hypothetical protein DFR86_02705 [Acidianus sulfidivorans JP7]